ncbi:MAG: chemotaxis protein CheB [Hylemonella sp.]|nr:chemotaxis protein CheB [Hylemonella sp.]
MVTRKKSSTKNAAAPRAPAVSGFPIVGIGASAGGLAAFEAFFSGMPADIDPGMAFVLVQHLAPDHESLLPDLIQRYTRMQVFLVVDGMAVQPNCAYVIPPNHDMAFINGTLQLLTPSAPRGQRLPIDYFFSSLAQDQGERAIAIVLSGTGSDGTLGLRAIKDGGGMVMAQSPDTTEFDGMPRSAIDTGLVDYQLPPAQMPAKLMAYVAQVFGKARRAQVPPAHGIDGALKKIFLLLRAQTGHDFTHYKPSTIHRRIERRMAVHEVASMDSYVEHLQKNPAEVEALFRDLLIGVTNFFRDPEAFAALEAKVIPLLFADKPADAVIRVWITACSTGEEAYSIAILLQEYLHAHKLGHRVQIFATDMDSRAVATARAGVYPAGIADDITPARLARFFTAESDGSAYRIHKSIRDMLVFSEHDLIKDPPFSRLDLISCRNLLIYLDKDQQRKLITVFHYALRQGGVLFLGASESVGDLVDLYSVLDAKSKLFQRKEDFQGPQRAALGRFLRPMSTEPAHAALPQAAAKAAVSAKLPLRELTEQALLRQLVPAGALVNDKGDILYLHGRTGMYLELVPGEAGINNILKMAREGLRRELTTALHKAVVSKQPVRANGLSVKTNGHFTSVNLTISPVAVGAAVGGEPALYLVILEDVPVPEPGQEVSPVPAGQAASQPVDARITALQQELRAKEEYLQAANDELESSNDELRSANEEMQSVNEELQSTNEELETSKEELQSVNEELATVNTELQTKVFDLSRANNDMNNLMAGTGIGTVFLDHDLRILRYTPATNAIINLIPGDVGRPIAHVVSNLSKYDNLVADVQAVLDTLVPREVDVQSRAGAWYTMRILPYRTLDNVIEGAVLTFIDITEVVRTRESLREANELLRLAVVVRDANDAVTVQDLDGHVLAWNPAAVRMYGWTEAEALVMHARDLVPEDLRTGALEQLQQLSRAEVLAPFQTRRLTRDGRTVAVWITASALVNEAGKVYAIATTERLGSSAAGR